ncbi:MAG: ROK family transcriptional regulator [Phocaeicola sp.]|nr:ROK family transcriptional regulator [Phocaeicola sp.]
MNLLTEIEKGTRSAAMKKKIIGYYLYNQSSTLPDLAKELNISVPTATKFVTEMLDDGYIISYGKLETSEGRPPTLYGLNPESGYFVGVDIKKFSLNFALMNLIGEITETRMGVKYKLENTKEGLETLCFHINEFLDSINISRDKIFNIGINISGRVNPESGYSFSQFNFEERPLAEILTEKIGLEVGIDNDTRAMTYGEMVKGAVKGEKDIIFINLSWGLGSGLIFNGKIYTGKSGFSGEFGHFNVFDNERICHCGKRGCLETEVSGEALYSELLKCVHEGKQSILSAKIKEDESSLTLYDIVDATNKEDLLCIELTEEIGQKLGRYLAGLINLLNPELVIIGGVLAQTGDYILQPIKSAVRKYSLNLVNKDSAIILSKLQEKAGVTGACMLARKKLFDFDEE